MWRVWELVYRTLDLRFSVSGMGGSGGGGGLSEGAAKVKFNRFRPSFGLRILACRKLKCISGLRRPEAGIEVFGCRSFWFGGLVASISRRQRAVLELRVLSFARIEFRV